MSEETKIYPGSIDTRVALLEQSIGTINQTLIEIKDIRSEINSNFRWTLGAFIGLGSLMLTGFSGMFAMMAHGFHWF